MRLVFLILLILISYQGNSQTLYVFDIDSTDFPIMRAKLFATDKNGDQITNLDKSDFEIYENGYSRNIINIDCPIPTGTEEISSVLTLDVSGSMTGASFKREIELAQKWIEMQEAGRFECAITAFNDKNYIVQDFTSDKNLLFQQLDNFAFVGGGTSYDAAMLDPYYGGLLTMKNAKYENRQLLMISDGHPNFPPKTQNIIDYAQNLKTKIHSFGIENKCDSNMIAFSQNTYGLYFDEIDIDSKFYEALIQLSKFNNNIEFCTISWESNSSCKSFQNLEIRSPLVNNTYTTQYFIPHSHVGYFQFEPTYIRLYSAEIGQTVTKSLRVYAKNQDFVVDNIVGARSDIEIVPKNCTIKAGEYQDFTISFAPQDSVYDVSFFEFDALPCGKTFHFSFGIPKFEFDSNIEVTFPNGGEVFLAGSDSIITWKNTATDKNVNIEFSNDAGLSWSDVTVTIGDTIAPWNNIPLPESDSCLIRISQTADDNIEEIYHGWDRLYFTTEFYENGDTVILGTNRGFIKVELPSLTRLDDYLCKDFIPSSGTRVIEISEENNFLFYSQEDSILKFDLNNFENWTTLPNISGNFEDIKYINDNTLLLVQDRSRFLLYDLTKSIIIDSLSMKYYQSHGYSFSDDYLALIKNNDRDIIIYSINKGFAKIDSIFSSTNVKSICWKNNSDLIYIFKSNAYNEIDISQYSLASKKLTNTNFSIKDRYCNISDNHDLCWYTYNDTIYVADLNTLNIISEFSEISFKEQASSKSISFMFPIPNKNQFLLFENLLPNQYSNSYLEIFDYKNKSFLNKVQIISTGVANNMDFAYSPDSRLSAISHDIKLSLYDNKTHKFIKTINHELKVVHDIFWTDDGQNIVGFNEQYLSIYDSKTLEILNKIRSYYLLPSTTNNLYLTNHGNNIMYVRDFITGDTISKIDHPNADFYHWNQNGTRIISQDLTSLKIWNVYSGELIDSIDRKKHMYLSIDNPFFHYTYDEKYILASIFNTWESEGRLDFFDLQSKEVVKSMPLPKGSYYSLHKYFNESKYLLLNNPEGYARPYTPSTIIYDIEKLEQFKKFESCYAINDIDFSKDFTKLAMIDDRIIRFFEGLPLSSQYDTSDSLFSIVSPKYETMEVDMKQVIVSEFKDSVVTAFIKNPGNYRNRVDNISIQGNDEADFDVLINDFPYYIEPQDSLPVEFRFTPSSVGLKTSEIVVEMQADTTFVPIKGEGIQPSLIVINEDIDFGKVPLGETKDTLDAITIANTGTTDIFISKTEHTFPNATDFKTLKGAGRLLLNREILAEWICLILQTHWALHQEYLSFITMPQVNLLQLLYMLRLISKILYILKRLLLQINRLI